MPSSPAIGRKVIKTKIEKAKKVHHKKMEKEERSVVSGAAALSQEIDASGETWNEDNEISEGLWSISTKHLPGFLKGLFEINNRAFVFRIRDKKGDFLIVLGVPNQDGVEAVQRLSKKVNLPVKFVISSGSLHHMYLHRWIEGFPNARILMHENKFPDTRNAKWLDDEYPNRIELYSGTKCQPLAKYKDQLQLIVFTELSDHRDDERTPINELQRTGYGKWKGLLKMMGVKNDVAGAYVWAYHRPTGLLLAEHNVSMWLTKEQQKKLPFPFSRQMKAEMFESAVTKKSNGSVVGNSQIHTETWNNIIKLDVRYISDFHRDPGQSCFVRFATPGEARQLLKDIVRKTGEDDPTGKSLWHNSGKKKSA